MKHLFISFILCSLTLSAFAQETDVNFALTANGATAIATSGNPLLAIDDNTGTRWESEHGVDPQTLTIDLGQPRTFNTIQIVWEGAYAKDFAVSTSLDNATWTPVLTVEDQYLLHYEQNGHSQLGGGDVQQEVGGSLGAGATGDTHEDTGGHENKDHGHDVGVAHTLCH